MDTTKDLINYVEGLFDCEIGPSTGYFDIGPERNIYVTYAAISNTEKSLVDWFAKNVFDPLLALGGKKIYWRFNEKIEYFQEEPPSSDEDLADFFACFPDSKPYSGRERLYTRLVAVDANNKAIKIDQKIKFDGQMIEEIEHE